MNSVMMSGHAAIELSPLLKGKTSLKICRSFRRFCRVDSAHCVRKGPTTDGATKTRTVRLLAILARASNDNDPLPILRRSPMKLVTLTSVLVLFGAGYALAGPGAGEPREPADPPSGRPAAVLDDTKCADVWTMSQREGDMLSEGQAAPFIVNFDLVDANDDGKISEAEFRDGCKQGLVQEAAASPQPSGESVPGASEPIEELSPDSEPLPQ
jgi:hypothetical protein